MRPVNVGQELSWHGGIEFGFQDRSWTTTQFEYEYEYEKMLGSGLVRILAIGLVLRLKK